ncbi:MAG: hypothetical protein J3R72DRAFT_383655, partial [Linnemannia gamsii]
FLYFLASFASSSSSSSSSPPSSSTSSSSSTSIIDTHILPDPVRHILFNITLAANIIFPSAFIYSHLFPIPHSPHPARRHPFQQTKAL